jgi:ATPase subunit of ABC transporter with duplicated ATPase domains
MLTVSDLSKTFNLQTLFKKINFSVNPGERVGLIGPNGSGKTTLLRILAGKEKASSGRVHHPNNFCLGYLPQVFEIEQDLAISDVIGRAVGDIEALEHDLEVAARKFAKDPTDVSLADRYDHLLHRIQAADQAGAEAILTNLGLSDIGSDTPVSILSGGQKTRLALALVLLGKPDMLLLRIDRIA